MFDFKNKDSKIFSHINQGHLEFKMRDKILYGIYWIFLLLAWILFATVRPDVIGNFWERDEKMKFILSAEILSWIWITLVRMTMK